MKRLMSISAIAAVALSMPAQAQFGGFGNMAKGMIGGGSSVSSGDADAFLRDATMSTKNVMIAAALLAQAVTSKAGLAGCKAQIQALENVQDIKELDAHRDDLKSNLATLGERSDLAGDLHQAYEAGNEQQRKAIGAAVFNLALGILRNTHLAGEAPGMIKGVSANPALLTRVGQFKVAGSLLGLQAQGLGGIATSIPKLLTATKVVAPSAAETTTPQHIDI